MKKIIISCLMIVGLSTISFAQKAPKGPDGAGYYGCCCCGPCDMGYGPMGKKGPKGPDGKGPKGKPVPAEESAVKSAKDAKAMVEAYVKDNFKGYKVGNVEEFDSRRGGKAYSIDVTDAGGNKAVFHINPWGRIVGPFFSNQ